MNAFFKNLFKKKPKKEQLSEEGCPIECVHCGKKSITLRRTLDKDKQPIKKFVSCSACKTNLATWENNKWSY